MILKTLALLVVLSMNYLSADAGLDSGSRMPKNEFQELAVILTKYGNNPKSMPVLPYAILVNDMPAVDLLLKYGASPLTSYKGNNCIYYTIQTGNIDLLKMFVDMGVSLDHVHDGYEDALWVAHHFNQVEIIDFLEEVNLTPSIENDLPPDRYSELEQLTRINTKYGNNTGDLPTLHNAILQGDVAAVDLLLKYGADPFTKNMHSLAQYNSLYYAIISGSVPIFKKLISLGLSIDYMGNGSINGGGIYFLVMHGHEDIVKFVINETKFPVKDLNALLIRIVPRKNFSSEKKIEIINTMVSQGANVNCNTGTNTIPPTLLALARYYGEHQLAAFLETLGAK